MSGRNVAGGPRVSRSGPAWPAAAREDRARAAAELIGPDVDRRDQGEMGGHPAQGRVADGPPQPVDLVGDRRVQQQGDAEPAPGPGHGQQPACQARAGGQRPATL